jgi:hypothetical protein
LTGNLTNTQSSACYNLDDSESIDIVDIVNLNYILDYGRGKEIQ